MMSLPRSRILKAIKLLRGRFVPSDDEEVNHTPYWTLGEIYTQGNCANFAHALQLLIGGTVLYSDEIAHYWLLYDGNHYDINGISKGLKALHENKLTKRVSLRSSLIDNYSPACRGPMI
jgi:hypothetical protein